MSDKKGFKKAGADLLFSANDQQYKDDAVVVEKPVKEEIITVNTDKPKKTRTSKYADILDKIKRPDELPGENMTFYLEKEIITAIINTANEMNVSRSKLINKILKQVLLGEE